MADTATTDYPEVLTTPGFSADAVEAVADFVGDPDWLRERRRAAWALFEQLPMPTTRDEHWRFTNLRRLKLDDVLPFTGCEEQEAALERAGRALVSSDAVATRIVSVNNAIWSGTVTRGELPAGVVVEPLHEAVNGEHAELVRKHLGSAVPATDSVDDKFVALNDATFSGGVFVYVPRGVKVEHPIEYLVAHAVDGGTLTPRVLVVLEEQAEATFVEEYASTKPGLTGFSNGVIELVVGQAATLHYVTSQDYSTEVTHFATHRVLAARDSQVEWTAVGLGGKLGKVRMEARLMGPGSSVKLNGAYFLDGTQQLDYDTQQFHEAPNAFSDLSFRGALAGRAHMVWRGMIDVAEGAQGTDSYQENRNLLLDRSAHADSIPGLQIEANEVRCTHGSTTSKVDREQLFYLQARGISKDEATKMIVRGFYVPVLDRITVEPIRVAIREALWARMAQ